MSLSQAGFFAPTVPTRAHTVSREATFAIFFGAAVFAAILWLPVVLRDPDTLWHITTGQWILANGMVPGVDTYSFTRAGLPWNAHEWLSEVVLALAYDWGGWNGVLILTAGAAGAVIGLLAFYLRRHCRTDIAIMLMLLAIACTGPSLLSRPHVIALPLLTLWMIGLLSARARSAPPPYYMLPVMAVWANLHGGFLIGLVMAGAMGLEALFDPACPRGATIRQWGIFCIGALVAATCTVHGIDGLLFPFRLMAMKNLYQIQEWKPSDFSHLTGVTVAILVALYGGLTGTLQFKKFRVLLLTGLVFATMQHVRNAQVFGVMAPLLIADSFSRGKDQTFRLKLSVSEWMPAAAIALTAILSLTCRIDIPLERLDEGGYASAALANVPAELRAKPVLNDYGFGGLLIFSGVKPFIDGRADLYGDDFMDMYLSIIHAKGDMLDEVLCRYNIEWTMFAPDTVVPALMDRTPGWHRIYSDKVAVIHVREPQAGRTGCVSSRSS